VHVVLHEVSEWQSLVIHRERDFVLEVLAPHGTRSVAQEEGLA
jgi:hypothetical protein